MRFVHWKILYSKTMNTLNVFFRRFIPLRRRTKDDEYSFELLKSTPTHHLKPSGSRPHPLSRCYAQGENVHITSSKSVRFFDSDFFWLFSTYFWKSNSVLYCMWRNAPRPRALKTAKIKFCPISSNFCAVKFAGRWIGETIGSCANDLLRLKMLLLHFSFKI